MRTLISFAVMIPLCAACSKTSDTPSVIYDRHLVQMKAGNLDGVLADYAEDAVVVAPKGIAGAAVFSGKNDLRRLFAILTDAHKSPGVRVMESKSEAVGHDVIKMRWAQFRGTPQYATGTDVFVIRQGKIAFQSVAPDATPTWP